MCFVFGKYIKRNLLVFLFSLFYGKTNYLLMRKSSKNDYPLLYMWTWQIIWYLSEQNSCFLLNIHYSRISQVKKYIYSTAMLFLSAAFLLWRNNIVVFAVYICICLESHTSIMLSSDSGPIFHHCSPKIVVSVSMTWLKKKRIEKYRRYLRRYVPGLLKKTTDYELNV
jgi:hypothetical protein